MIVISIVKFLVTSLVSEMHCSVLFSFNISGTKHVIRNLTTDIIVTSKVFID